MAMKNLFKKNTKTTNKNKDFKKQPFFKVTDYSKWLLVRLLGIFFIFIIAFIPIVQYLMYTFENREITLGQAAVFIMQTITTTGYGELLPFTSTPMVVVSIILMAVGVFMIFIIAGTLMATLIEKRITPRAPLETQLSGHIVFTAFNETVEYTIEYLTRNNIPYVVAEPDQSSAVTLIEKGINSICSNPAYDEGLEQLNVKEAQLVIATSDDTSNISITLGISSLYGTPTLAVMENEKRAQLAYAAGAQHIVALEETVGKQIVDWICSDASPTEFLKLIDVNVSPEVLDKLKPSIIHVGSYGTNQFQTIGEAKLRTKTGASVVAVWHPDGTISIPTADTPINEATLIVLGPYNNVDELASFLGGPGPGEHVVIAGAGRVGQVAGRRLNQVGIRPVIIDVLDREKHFDGELIVGDATFSNVLEEAQIKSADTIIAALNADHLNIFTVLASKQMNPDINIVARAVRPDSAERIMQAGANHVLSEAILGFQLLQMTMVEMGIIPKLSSNVIREITWNKEPTSLMKIVKNTAHHLHVICIVKPDYEVLEPQTNHVIQTGDRLVALGAIEDINSLSG